MRVVCLGAGRVVPKWSPTVGSPGTDPSGLNDQPTSHPASGVAALAKGIGNAGFAFSVHAVCGAELLLAGSAYAAIGWSCWIAS